jgi:hypothetical protein
MTTTATAGDYKTIRTPGAQVAQCLAITVAVGSKIQITCTAVYTQAGTYTTVIKQPALTQLLKLISLILFDSFTPTAEQLSSPVWPLWAQRTRRRTTR